MRKMEVTIRRGECAEMSECTLKCEENTSREENKENMGVNALEWGLKTMKWENRWCVSTELCSPRRERERRGEEKEEVRKADDKWGEKTLSWAKYRIYKALITVTVQNIGTKVCRVAWLEAVTAVQHSTKRNQRFLCDCFQGMSGLSSGNTLSWYFEQKQIGQFVMKS